MRDVRRVRRAFLFLTVAMAALATTLVAPPRPAHAEVPVARLAGADRYATAAAISAATFPSGAGVVFLATGETFPDALAGGPAAARAGGPVLLVRRGSLPEATAAELRRLAPGRAVVLGGPMAVSDAVVTAVRASGVAQVERLAGADRYATAAAIAAATFSPGVAVAYLATGSTFPDALAGSAAAARQGAPVLLTGTRSLPAPIRAELSRLAPRAVTVLGGPAALGPEIENELRSLTGAPVGRVAGADRYATAAAIALATTPAGTGSAFLATGETFPDALAGGPAAGLAQAPLLLTPRSCVPDVVREEMARLAPGRLVVLGGEAAISTPAVDQLRLGAASSCALLKARPFVRLFTQTDNCSESRQVNELTGATLESRLGQLLSWYTHFHAEGSNHFALGANCQGASADPLAAKLAARGAMVSNYRNGSYVSQSSSSAPANFGEAADLEARAPRAIATFWAGNSVPYVAGDDNNGGARLAAAVDPASAVVRVTSAAAQRPAGAPLTWPFVNSRGGGAAPGAHSANTRDVVSWIRVDDELMQIVAEPVEAGGVVTLTVARGLWGTGAANHGAGTRVMSPVYIGSTSAVASDGNLAGGPNRNDPNFPLRYGIKIWQPEGWGWLADRIGATFAAHGYNTAWLDVSSCAQYNNADAWGRPVFGWDDPAGTKLTRDRWGAHQKTKLAGLRSRFPGWRFAGNNLGGNFNACTEDLLGNAYDGGVLEHWMKADGNWSLDWAGSMDQSFKIQSRDWPGIYWVRWNYDFQGDPAAYKRFSYGSLLLSWQPTATRFQYGGPWGLGRPDDLYFWDFGRPLTTPAGVADLAVAGTTLYRREFANGVVLVNPGGAAQTIELGATFGDVSAGGPTSVARVTVPARDAVFLIR